MTEIFSLKDRNALVTGASSGLGRHFAEVLANSGANIALAARRLDRLTDAGDRISVRTGVKTACFELDVTSLESVQNTISRIEESLGPIDILINNAGVASEAWFLKTSDRDWRKTLDVNLDGVFRVGREVANHMKQNAGGGSIINIASILGFGVLPSVSAYSVSKAAVIQLTRAMALELARDNIRVNALAPGYFPTDINKEYLQSEAGRTMLDQKVPMCRFGNLAELDGALLLLASDAGSYMTGSTITVDGGTRLTLG